MMNEFGITGLQENSLRLLEMIYKLGPITRIELCNLLEKKMTPVNRMLAPLLESGMVTSIKKGESTGGRKPVVYDINPTGYYIASVNLSSTYYEVSILNFKLEVLALQKTKMSHADIPESVLERIVLLLNSQLDDLEIPISQVYGMGLALFSSFSAKTGKLFRPMYMAPNKLWLDIPIAKVLREKTGLAVRIEKGTNAAAFLEYSYGKGKKYKKMLYVLCAMNIRSASISDNQIINDAPYCEDSFGHMTIDIDGELCECGNYGCVATFTTIPAIIKSLATEIKMGRDFPYAVKHDEITFDDVCLAVNEGNDVAREVIIRSATVLGIALANYINMFAPEIVFISGLTVQNCGLYFDVAVETAKRKVSLFNKEIKVQFEKESIFATPITIGIGAMVIEGLFERKNNV